MKSLYSDNSHSLEYREQKDRNDTDRCKKLDHWKIEFFTFKFS